MLTKADTVPEGEHDIWISILENKSHRLHHGYYVTRLPATKEMDQSWKETQSKEKTFFQSNQSWNKVDRKRTGVENLARALSLRLTQMIEETFNPH